MSGSTTATSTSSPLAALIQQLQGASPNGMPPSAQSPAPGAQPAAGGPSSPWATPMGFALLSSLLGLGPGMGASGLGAGGSGAAAAPPPGATGAPPNAAMAMPPPPQGAMPSPPMPQQQGVNQSPQQASPATNSTVSPFDRAYYQQTAQPMPPQYQQ